VSEFANVAVLIQCKRWFVDASDLEMKTRENCCKGFEIM